MEFEKTWEAIQPAVIGIGMACGLLVATFFVVRKAIRTHKLGVLGVFVVVIWGGVIYVMFHRDEMIKPSAAISESNPADRFPPSLAEMVVLKRLRDPASAVFGSISVYDDRKLKGKPVVVACGSVNSKNGFGGYTFSNTISSNRTSGSNPSWTATHSSVLPGFPRDREMSRKFRLFAHSLWSLGSRLAVLQGEIAESLRPFPQIFPFWETIAGDGFDQDCRPTTAL